MSRRQPGDPPKFMMICDAFGNFFILNLLFVICCIPIVTIGASINSLCTMMIRYIEEREGRIVKGFFTEFKKGFLKSTIIWMIYIVSSLMIYTEYLILKTAVDPLRMFIVVIIALELIFVVTTFPFVFWLNARYENTIVNMFINSFVLFVKRLWTWIRLVVIWAGPVLFMLFFSQILIKAWWLWVVILISFLTYVCGILMKKEFAILEEPKEQLKEATDGKSQTEQVENKNNTKEILNDDKNNNPVKYSKKISDKEIFKRMTAGEDDNIKDDDIKDNDIEDNDKKNNDTN